MTGGYSIKVNGGTNDGKYISGTNGSNALNFNATEQLNTISFSSSSAVITSNTSVLRFNPSSGNVRFRYFKSTTYTSQKEVQLYKKKVIPAPTAIAFKTGETTYTNGGVTKNDLGSGASVDVTIVPNQTADVYYTLDGTAPTTSSAKYTSAIAITGPCTLKALAKNSAGEYTESVAFKFSRANGLAYSPDDYTAYLSDGTFKATLTNPNSLPVTYESYDTDVATVAADGTVTMKTAGETMITATFAGDDTYAAGDASYMLTISDKVSAGLAFAQGFIHIEEPTYNSEIAAPVALTNPHGVTVTYSSSDETVATVNNSTGAVTPKKLGTTTIKATFAGNATYEEADVSYTLKLGLQEANLMFEDDSHDITYSVGATYTMDFIKDTDAPATFSSSNTAVATVNATTGEVTVQSVGTTTITATTAKTSDFKAGEAEYTLTVTENATASGAVGGNVTIFEENVSKYTGTSDGTATITSSNYSNNLDCDDTVWDFSGFAYAYPGRYEGSIKLGNGSNAGTIKTKSLAITGNATLSFKAANWSASESAINISVTGATASQTSITVSDTYDQYSVDLTGATGNVVITISSSPKRGFVGQIKLTQATTSTIDVTVPASGWGTYCSPYALDLGNAETTVTAYSVSAYDVDNNSITLVKQTGKVPAKTPLVIQGEAGAKKIAVAEGETAAPAKNILRGYLSPTYYAGADASETLMGMSGGNFKKLQAGVIPANRAALVMDTDDYVQLNPLANDGRFTFIIVDNSETTGISQMEKMRNGENENTPVYNLAGQRVGNDYKGIVIVNGKKVVRK